MSRSATGTLPHRRSLTVVHEQAKMPAITLANGISKMSSRIAIQIAVTEKLGANIGLCVSVATLSLLSK